MTRVIARTPILVGALAVAGAQGAVAENTGVCEWPDLDAALASSADIVVVEVTRTFGGCRPGDPSRFRYRVLEDLSGHAAVTGLLRSFLADGDDCAPPHDRP